MEAPPYNTLLLITPEGQLQVPLTVEQNPSGSQPDPSEPENLFSPSGDLPFVVNQVFSNMEPPLEHEYAAVVKTELSINHLWDFHKCKLCSFKTKSACFMKFHTRRHRMTRNSKIFNCERGKIESYKCQICDYRSPFVINYNKHIHMSHKFEVKLEDEEKEQSVLEAMRQINMLKGYNCESCTFRTFSQLIYVSHVKKCPVGVLHKSDCQWRSNKEIIEERIFHCGKCPYVAKRKTTLEGHIRNKHPFPRTTLFKKRRLYYCRKCQFRTRSEPSFKVHVKRHNVLREEEPQGAEPPVAKPPPLRKPPKSVHKCGLCPFQSTLEAAFLNHLFFKHCTDGDINWVFCDQCSYKSLHPSRLQAHKRLKHTPRGFQCELCPFRARKLTNLRKHVLLKHFVNDEPPQEEEPPKGTLKCEACDYSTHDHKVLTDHILNEHVEAEIVTCFRCKLCTFRSIASGELEEHVLVKHVDSQYDAWVRCEMCTDKVRNAEELKKHIFDKHIM